MRKFTLSGIAMAAMVALAGAAFTACGDDEETVIGDPPGGGDGQGGVKAVSHVTAEYSAIADSIGALEALTGGVFVRYVGEDNAIHQEPFTGQWEKTVNVPASDGKYAAALQVIGTAKDSATISSLSGVYKMGVNTKGSKFTLNYTDGTSTVVPELLVSIYDMPSTSLPEHFTALWNNIKSRTETYGGLAFGMAVAAMGDTATVSYSEFWPEHKYVGESGN